MVLSPQDRGFCILPLFAAALLLGGCHEGPLRIMPLGASYTAGLTVIDGQDVFQGGYRRELETLLVQEGVDFEFVGSQEDPPTADIVRKHHEGHRGWRIDSIDGSASTWVSRYRPDVVLLLVGTNDILQNYSLASAPDRLDTLVGHLLKMDSVKYVFVSSILPLADLALDAKVQTYNAAIETRISARKLQGQPVDWVDIYNDSGVTVQELSDGIHPDALGYDKMAHVWFDSFTSSFWHFLIQ
jgi:acyl-CoA thioesterase-1